MGTPVWKGRLAYGGRSFAAKILTGARAESISFNQLHRADLSRVKQVLHCAAEDKAIPRDELVKGYEFEKERYIVLDEAEIKSLAPDPPTVIDLKKFVPLAQVDPIYFESSYYVAPDGDGEPDYAALFGSLRRTSLAGVQTVCLYSRERPLLFRAGATGIIAHALFYASELRMLDQFRTIAPDPAPELGIGDAAVKRLASGFDPIEYEDAQRVRTQALIAKKIAALPAPKKPAESAKTRKAGAKAAPNHR
jgi:DNA end-binding protein Ku